jgi:transposase
MFTTYKYRIKDKNKINILNKMDRDVKFVWNVINGASRKRWNESRLIFHKYNPWFTSITKGASKYLDINAQTIQAILSQFHKDIHQQKKQLRFKGKKTLGWIPFKGQSVRLLGDCLVYNGKNGKKFRIWKSRSIKGIIKSGSFNQDSLGRWYINITFETKDNKKGLNGQVGLDLGLKTTVTSSNGDQLNLNILNFIDKLVAKQQRAKNKRRVKTLHAYKTNKRKDMINKFALELVKRNTLIAIGNVQGFTKGNLAKSRYNNS